MLFPILFVTILLISPQLWLEPFVGLRVDYVVYPGWLIYLIYSSKIGRLNFGPQEKFFIFWILWMGISLIANRVFLDKMGIFLVYVKWLVMYIFIAESLDETNKIFYFFIVITSLSTILCIEGIDHYLTGIGWAGQPLGWSEGETGRTQWVGDFDGPGVFCVIYTITVPFLLILFDSKKIFNKLTGIMLLTLFGAAIFVNGSRGGIVACVAVFGLHYGFKYFKIKKFSIIIVSAGFIYFLSLLPSNLTNLADSHHSSSHRVEMWAAGCDMVKENPVFGIGRGRFVRHSGSLIAHSSFVEIMGETGVIGLFAWIGTIYFGFKKLYLFIIQSDKMNVTTRIRDKNLAWSLVVCIVGYLVSAMFVTLEYELFYLLLGVCAAFGRNLEQPIDCKWIDVRNISILVFGWLFFINGFVHFVGPGAFY